MLQEGYSNFIELKKKKGTMMAMLALLGKPKCPCGRWHEFIKLAGGDSESPDRKAILSLTKCGTSIKKAHVASET
jgi:hypothetical protein